MTDTPSLGPALRVASARGRWVIAGAVLGTGVAFLDGTVVTTALPAIDRDLGAGLTGLQWVMTSYLLTLGSLLVIGGSLGDLFGRRKIFVIGLLGFAGTSLACGLAPSALALVAARALQGVAAALLVPGSLAIISSTFHPEDRGRAIGAWSGLGGVATAAGPFIGGWLIDSVSWRLVFIINLPLIAAATFITIRHVPETRESGEATRVDYAGGTALATGLAGLVYALIEGPPSNWRPLATAALAVGLLGIATFVAIELRSDHPMVPLGVFSSRQFSGANLVTLVIYGALGASTFLLVVYLQVGMGYSALAAGASLLPITILLLLFSARSGALAQRIGPRLQMTVGPMVIAASFLMLTRIRPGSAYLTGVLPAVTVLGLGLAITVAPLTTAVLAAIDDDHAGIGSAINNAAARIAALLAIALLPALAGATTSSAIADSSVFRRAMLITAGFAASAAAVAFATIRTASPVEAVALANPATPCMDPCVKLERAS